MTKRKRPYRSRAHKAYFKACAAAAEGWRDALMKLITVTEPSRDRVDTVAGALHGLMLYRGLIVEWLGEDAAHHLLARDGPTPAAHTLWMNEQILRRYDAMPNPNIEQLARDLVAENEKESGWWVRGGTDLRAMKRQIYRAIEEREKRVKSAIRRYAPKR
jgi:hypothetical protein